MRPSQRYEILKRDNFTCRYCGRKAPEVELQVDHYFPRSLGGLDKEWNLVASCRACNIGKSNKIPDEHDYLSPEEVMHEAALVEREAEQVRRFARALLHHAKNLDSYHQYILRLDRTKYHPTSKFIGGYVDFVCDDEFNEVTDEKGDWIIPDALKSGRGRRPE